MNKEKMKAKCEAWIKEGMGACRAPITYDELLGLIQRLDKAEFSNMVVQKELRKFKETAYCASETLEELKTFIDEAM